MVYFNRIIEAVQRKFGGKTLAIESFVMRRTNAFIQNKKRPVLPSLEMAYIFYGFNQMDNNQLAQSLSFVDNFVSLSGTSNGYPSISVEDVLIVSLIRGSCLSAMKRYHEADKLLKQIVGTPEKEAKQELYVIPFAYFELAANNMEQVIDADKKNKNSNNSDNNIKERTKLLADAKAQLKSASAFKSAYDFKNRLHFRIHLANVELKQLIENKETAH